MSRTVAGIRGALQGSDAGRSAIRIAEAAESRGARAYLVGGFVRDWLLGGASPDLDIEVFGIDPDPLRDLLKDLFGRRPEAAGRSFPVFKVFLPVRAGASSVIDVGLPRRERSTGPGHRDFSVAAAPDLELREAASRRDFTINAIYLDPLAETLADPFDGATDLDARRLRMVDPERFAEDPLRVCRAAQFAARFELEVEPVSLGLMREMVEAGQLDALPPERISAEVQKLLLQSERPSIGFELLSEMQVCRRHLPELHALIGVEQDPRFHPEGDVWIHTMLVIDAAARIIRRDADCFDADESLQVMCAALVHDLGKPAVTKVVDGRVRAHAHEASAEAPIRGFFSHLRFPTSCLQAALVAAELHLRPAQLEREFENGNIDEKRYANAARRLIRAMRDVNWRVVLGVVEADLAGRTTPEAPARAYGVVRRFAASVERFELERQVREPLVGGSDLLSLGVAPGPELGALIARVESLRDDGELETRDAALAWVRRRLDGETQ